MPRLVVPVATTNVRVPEAPSRPDALPAGVVRDLGERDEEDAEAGARWCRRRAFPLFAAIDPTWSRGRPARFPEVR